MGNISERCDPISFPYLVPQALNKDFIIIPTGKIYLIFKKGGNTL